MDDESDSTSEYMFKVNFIGNSGVGKTALIHSYSEKAFTDDYRMQIGTDFELYEPNRQFKGGRVRLLLMDTYADTPSRFRSSILTGTSVLVAVYDITDKYSFDYLNEWLIIVRESGYIEQCPVAVIGNKADLRESSKSTVDPQEGRDLAEVLTRELDVQTLFLETSAKTKQNTQRLLSWILDALIDRDFAEEFPLVARETVNTDGWAQTIERLRPYESRQVLEYLGIGEFVGSGVTTDEILDVITTDSSFTEGVEIVKHLAEKHLMSLLERGSQTYEIDIFRMQKTDAARFVLPVVELRKDEILKLVKEYESTGHIDIESLKRTYYGRLIVERRGLEPTEEEAVGILRLIAGLIDEKGNFELERRLSRSHK